MKLKLKDILIVIGVIALDLITKQLISSSMDLHESIEIIKGFFSITYVWNTGAAFSILEGNMLFFYIITIGAVIFLTYLLFKAEENEKLYRLGLLFMIGGALGNFIDRILYQHVRDFLDFIIFGWDFAIFNVADCFLCIGVLLLAISIFVYKKEI